MIKEDEEKFQEIQKNLKEFSQAETFNQYGIMNGSVLTVEVIEGRDLKTILGAPNSFVYMQMGNQVQQTDIVKGEYSPIWNEVLTFDIENGREVIDVIVMNKGGSEIGRC